jgi:NADP-dependent 3-hydroxy acid dehydrogenase YdfG
MTGGWPVALANMTVDIKAAGAAVVLGARRTECLDKLAEEIRDRGRRAINRATDVTQCEDFQCLADAAVAEFGRLDVLVSNADISKIGPTAYLDVDGWQAKNYGLWRVAEDDLDSDLYAETSDADTVIGYIAAHA